MRVFTVLTFTSILITGEAIPPELAARPEILQIGTGKCSFSLHDTK